MKAKSNAKSNGKYYVIIFKIENNQKEVHDETLFLRIKKKSVLNKKRTNVRYASKILVSSMNPKIGMMISPIWKLSSVELFKIS